MAPLQRHKETRGKTRGCEGKEKRSNLQQHLYCKELFHSLITSPKTLSWSDNKVIRGTYSDFFPFSLQLGSRWTCTTKKGWVPSFDTFIALTELLQYKCVSKNVIITIIGIIRGKHYVTPRDEAHCFVFTARWLSAQISERGGCVHAAVFMRERERER